MQHTARRERRERRRAAHACAGVGGAHHDDDVVGIVAVLVAGVVVAAGRDALPEFGLTGFHIGFYALDSSLAAPCGRLLGHRRVQRHRCRSCQSVGHLDGHAHTAAHGPRLGTRLAEGRVNLRGLARICGGTVPRSHSAAPGARSTPPCGKASRHWGNARRAEQRGEAHRGTLVRGQGHARGRGRLPACWVHGRVAAVPAADAGGRPRVMRRADRG